jgi:WD40 repeat protein
VRSLRSCGVLSSDGGLVTGIAFSPDGQCLALGYANKAIKLWEVKSRSEQLTLVGHTAPVNGVAYSDDGHLATASADNTVRIWDVGSVEKELWTMESPCHINRAVFLPDDTHVVLALADNTCQVWDWRTNREITILHGHTRPINSIAVPFSSNR